MSRPARGRLLIALSIYLAFTLLFLAANALMRAGEGAGTLAAMEPLAGALMGLLMFPVFAIGLPLWLARRWELPFSFWPRRKPWPLAALATALYVGLMQWTSLSQLAALNIAPGDFLLHTASAMLFHVSYYPLFAGLLLPVLRRAAGNWVGLIATALLFALYHLAGFYYFPAGVTPRMQVFLTASFLASLLLYLWTESMILVALAHSVNGAFGLALNGTLFNQVNEMLIVTAVLMTGLFAYMIVYELRHRERPYAGGWWLALDFAGPDSGTPGLPEPGAPSSPRLPARGGNKTLPARR